MLAGFSCMLAVHGMAGVPRRAGDGTEEAADTRSPAAVVATMAANEVVAHKQETHFSYLSEERSPRTGGHLWREKVVEAQDGPLHRLLAIDGRSLSPGEVKAESDRIAGLVRDRRRFGG